jgi:hypothetical protein
MNAREYLDKHGKEKAEAMAKTAGTNLAYFSQIAAGVRRPSVNLAQRLVDASNGELDFVALLTAKNNAA